MKLKNILYLVFVCNTANASNIKVSDCSYDLLIQQDKVYWCLVDKYQQSVLALKYAETSAEKRLQQYDDKGARGHNEDGSIDYEPYIHQARTTFAELHRSFILYREKQCSYSSMSNGALPGYRTPIASLSCKIDMNLSQIQWIKNFI
ncbi:lysozyme inhibitor LprI family protein [Hafnia paralvei]|uniref:lysozyme inhibitor LprI family protein n=1 Tax=Hafnia paralvei TaxID=546367 RepID=UPI000BB55235|nr:lysozyme inhibitor LprI family protein [Hafnia paralvei]MCE9947989.1 lysozyme inhibitor LprI family protein [Hafnia paralvei]PNK68323.1 DUF1311 domain-containing protein [Hafnia paralvei]